MFLTKTFLGRNLKNEKASKKLTSEINSLGHFSYIIVNRHDLLIKEQLISLQSKTENLFSLLWDSLQKIPQLENNIDLFRKIYSFDNLDCEQHGFIKIDNFYFIRKETVTGSFKLISEKLEDETVVTSLPVGRNTNTLFEEVSDTSSIAKNEDSAITLGECVERRIVAQ